MIDKVLKVKDISKVFIDGDKTLTILERISFDLSIGQHMAIVGPSGSGKSTLLQIIAGLQVPTEGSVEVDGYEVQNLSEKKLNLMRNSSIGFIYQFHHLLAEFSAVENVMLPNMIKGFTVHEAKVKALKLLDDVGLKDRAYHKPSALSGGEKQRVAIARALINKPKCVMADEPTGNLDTVNARKIFELMQSLTKKYNTSFIIVTHDLSLATEMDLVFKLENKKISLVN